MLKFLLKVIRFLFFGADQNVIHYICNGKNVLPEKLSAEEELVVVKEISMGSEAAKQELTERNLRLVVYTAQKFESTGLPIEDLISVGTIGLIKAVNSFKHEKKIKFATYASRCIENEILMYLRKTIKIKKEVSLDDPLNIDKDGNELLLGDILGTEPDIVSSGIEKTEECNILKEALLNLSKREQEIMQMRFGIGIEKEMTQKEVADRLDISQSYISRLEKKIISRLKKEITQVN